MNAEAVPSHEILDLDTMQQLLDLDDGELGLLREMYVLFRDDTPPRIAQLEQAIQEGNGNHMGDMAHAVKGAASTMGILKVRALAQILESAGRTGTCDGNPVELLAQLKSAFAEALVELERFIASKG